MTMAAPNPSTTPSQTDEYGMEVLCANWNPVATAEAEPVGRVCRKLLADLPAIDVDAFLKQFYRYQKS